MLVSPILKLSWVFNEVHTIEGILRLWKGIEFLKGNAFVLPSENSF